MIHQHQEEVDFKRLLGPEGPLARESFYEFRSGQVEMAEAVWKTLTEGGKLFVEAGTGTGKSLAYLLPSFFLNQRVVVSTRTKTLQDQLARKDIPLCSKLLGREPRTTLVKGRANYLCRYYWERFLKEPLLTSRGDAKYLSPLKKWAEHTKTGDRDEWSGIPENLGFWREINARADRCLGSACPLYQDCYTVKVRREAEAAELIVTNHHLLFADLAVKARWDSAVLPEYTRLIMDEAHEAEDAATSFFGSRASRRMFEEWLRDTAALFRSGETNRILESLQQANRLSAYFFGMLKTRSGFDGVKERLPIASVELEDDFEELKRRFWTALDTAALVMDALEEKPEELSGLLERLDNWREAVDFVLNKEEDGFVRWIEVGERNVTLGASPIEVGSILEEHLYSRLTSAVFTSATLTVADSFKYLEQRLGVSEEAAELVINSPFDFESQGMLYVPGSIPVPSDPRFGEALVDTARRLIAASRGRAFVLCTSFRNMNLVAEGLKQLEYPLLVQGRESKGRLIERFKEAGNAVLVATSSFWQGVDVQGAALSLVVIDKIPFAVPSEPVVEARINKLRKSGINPFSTYQVPSAAIVLKQGVGRLIRSKSDRGAVACLDARLRNSRYGNIILRSLPPFKRTDRLEDVDAFFREGKT